MVFKFRGRIRAQLREAILDLQRIANYNTQHPSKNLLSGADVSSIAFLQSDFNAALQLKVPKT